MTKLTDLEADLTQHRTESNERLDRLEQSMETLRVDSEKRHDDLRQLLLSLQKAAAPPPADQTSATLPPNPSAAITAPPSHQPSAALSQSMSTTMPLPYGNDLPPPFSYMYPPPITAPDTHGLPPPSHPDAGSSHYQSSRPPPDRSLPPYSFGAVITSDTGLFAGDSGPGRGPGPPGDRPWLPSADYRLRKLKMPIFDGEDAFGWVYRMERYFDIQGFVTTGEKIRAAVLCMEGQALAWYRWAETRAPFRHWEGLKARLLERFQPSHEGDIYEQFLAITQSGTVREYIGVFETLAAQLVGVPERVLEGAFVKGLKPEIRSSVRMLQPVGLTQTIKTALLTEEGRSAGSGEAFRGGTRSAPLQQPRATPGISRQPPVTIGGGVKAVTGILKQPYRRMTDAELADKRAKGLCYRCDGKFAPGHRCPDKSLHVLIIAGDDIDDGTEVEETHVHLDIVEVSAQSVMGLTAPKTMKLRGLINGTEVVVLIDSGATHNFVSLQLVGQLRLPVTGSQATGVVMGNGTAERCYGICLGVMLQLQGLAIKEDFFPLELGSTDVILGVKWLRQLERLE